MSNNYEDIKERILNNTDTTLNKIEGSTISNLASPIAEELAKGYMNMDDILKLGFIEDTFYDFLDKRVNEFGVYRKEGTKAVGELVATGEDGTIISNSTILVCNGLMYTVLNDIVLPSTENVFVEALEVGYQYKQSQGVIFAPIETIKGLASLTAISDFTKGTDIENDEELYARFQKVVSNPSTSGNIYHYEQWALESEGIGKAVVYPLWAGNGTVKVMVIGNDNKPVDQELVDSCKAHIEEEMPIGCTLTVTTPTLLDTSITGIVKVAKDFIIEEVNASFRTVLDQYMKTVTNEIVYSKVYGLLAGLVGVEDVTELKINSGTSNVTIEEDKMFDIVTVEISEVV